LPKKLDPVIADVLKTYGFGPDACWDCHGTWVVYHRILEQIGAKAGIAFDAPQIIEAASRDGIATMCVTGRMGDRAEWSFGEASPKNNKTAYPWAMSEKRAKDRVILKLIGLHGLAYSEEEADEFKEPPSREPAPLPPVRVVTGKTIADEPTESELKVAALLNKGVSHAATLPDLKVWWALAQTQSLLKTLPDSLRASVEEHKETRKAELTADDIRMAN